jgi:hypothetical protein
VVDLRRGRAPDQEPSLRRLGHGEVADQLAGLVQRIQNDYFFSGLTDGLMILALWVYAGINVFL